MKTSSLLCGLCLLLISASCKKEKNTSTAQNLDEEREILSQYFDAATSGVISVEESFHYLLKSPLAKDVDTNTLQKFISLEPAVNGRVVLANRSIITFIPDKPLQSNTTYQVTLDLPILDANVFQRKITYTVQTLEQQLKLEKKGFVLQDNGQVDVMVDVKSSDVVDLNALESCFGVKGAAKSFEMLDKHHYLATFTFENVSKANTNIEFDGSPLQSETEASLTPFVIPTESFDVVHDYHDKDSKEINIYFSKILDVRQDLTGLLTVGGNAVSYSADQNVLKIFLETLSTRDVVELVISKGVLAKDGSALAQDYRYSIENRVQTPAIDFVSSGNYFPSEGDFKIPVKARGLESAKIMVVEIKQENVAHYLAWHSLEYADYYSLRMYGKPIFDEVVPLREGLVDDDGFSVYGIDLTKQIKKNPGSIYHVSLDFLPEHTKLSCKAELEKYTVSFATPSKNYFYSKNADFREEYMYYEDYSWEKNEDPCDISFYAYKQPVQKILICSDYAVIAKKAGSTYHVAVNKLMDLSPVSGADITMYDLQAEMLGSSSTSGDGMAQIKSPLHNGAVIKITKGGQTTYLSLDEADSNPLTEYDISGEMSETDTEMFVYTDRDVWRPGDSIYVNVMFHHQNADLPQGLPLVCSFINTEGVQIQQQVKPIDLEKRLIYTFVLHTNASAKTGRYRCVLKYGTRTYRQNIQVETIKPNTTETILNLANSEQKVVYSPTLSGTISSQYLTGFPAPKTSLKAVGKFYTLNTPFPEYAKYSFNTPGRKNEENIPLFETKTDAKGEASFSAEYDFTYANSPGNLQIEIESVLDGGGANKEGKSIKISPFESYVGADRKVGTGWAGNHTFKENIDINLIRLDKKGKVLSENMPVSYRVYRHLDQWWIDKYRLQHWGNFQNDDFWAFVRSDAVDVNGKGMLRLAKGSLEKGAYKVVFTDDHSGHESAVFFTVYDGIESIPGKEAHLLELMTEKDEYQAGQSISLRLPDVNGAKALVSVERGKEIIQQTWHDIKASNNIIQIQAQESWTPNVYLHVTILQPYKKANNDLPLRMYGVKSIKLSGKTVPLTPVTDIPSVLESEKSYTFSVSEKQGRPMEYTVALVDEGLLNLKGFRTPDPHTHFNGKYPLLVKTWDIYKYLMSFFSGQFAGIISIGGDDAYKADALQEVNRFPPVVIHLGSFNIGSKGSKKHTIKIPNYIGKLRLMVVACNKETFGSTEKMVTVKNPLMVQTRFPRSLQVTDKIRLPIQVFKDDASITSAVLSAKMSKNIVKGLPENKTVTFGKDNMSTVYVNAEVLNSPGKTNIDMTIQGNGKSMTEKTEIAVQYPNAYSSAGEITVIKPGASSTFEITSKGYLDVFKGKFIISGLLAPDFVTYAERLIEYPYGCLEQTTSAGFGQLFLDKLLELDPATNQTRLQYLRTTVNKISSLQRGGGSFNYWDNDYYHGWSDMYAGHFLLEMKNLGYIPNDNQVFQNWLNFSYQRANAWSFTGANQEYYYESECLTHAYRLYVLAKANKPAKSAMNRFMTTCTSKNPMVWWLLAGSFIHAGFDSKGKEMIAKAEQLAVSYEEKYRSYYFQSEARDFAFIVEILAALPGEKAKLDKYFIEMVNAFNAENWHSTQDMGFACLATYAYYGGNLGMNKDVEYKITGLASVLNYKHKTSVYKTIPVKKSHWNKKIEIKNNGKTALYVNRSLRFIDDKINLPAEQKEVKMSVQYYNKTRKKPGLENCGLGDDVIITVQVTNPNATALRNMALNLTIPSGFELINPRLYQTNILENSSGFEYQDYKDDRVYTFFTLEGGKSKTYYFLTKAAFTGDFYLPRIVCENMYRGNIVAKTASGRVSIVQ